MYLNKTADSFLGIRHKRMCVILMRPLSALTARSYHIFALRIIAVVLLAFEVEAELLLPLVLAMLGGGPFRLAFAACLGEVRECNEHTFSANKRS